VRAPIVGKHALWPRTRQQRVRMSRTAFRETNGHAVDDAKARRDGDLAQRLASLVRCHDTLSLDDTFVSLRRVYDVRMRLRYLYQESSWA
jgi:hypothetical protein